jgi:predicted RNA-binding Zn-ribbon protein involved in translation (DUF1610 family)
MADKTRCPECGSTDSKLCRNLENLVRLGFSLLFSFVFPAAIPLQRRCESCGARFDSKRGQPKFDEPSRGFPVLPKHPKDSQNRGGPA